MQNPKPNPPSYIFLMAEYVATLEALQRFPVAPFIKEQAGKRLNELKGINIKDLCVEHICKELMAAKKQG